MARGAKPLRDTIVGDCCTTQFGTYFSGDWDVRWGYGLLTHGSNGLRNPLLVGFNGKPGGEKIEQRHFGRV